jgi:hypothetical protein
MAQEVKELRKGEAGGGNVLLAAPNLPIEGHDCWRRTFCCRFTKTMFEAD